MRSFQSGLRNPVERSGDRLGAGGALRQFLFTEHALRTITVAETGWAFLEVLGMAGAGGNGFGGSGGAGSDAIVAVAAGDVLTVRQGFVDNTGNPEPATTIRRGGNILVSASNGVNGTPGGTPPKATGKYVNADVYFGGGRLATQPSTGSQDAGYPGLGKGVALPGVVSRGLPASSLTFFATYDEALAFAKSLYGGSWVP